MDEQGATERLSGSATTPRALNVALRRRWAAWSQRGDRLARGLLLAAGATLWLDAAATVNIGYTVQLAQLVLAAAVVVGLPHLWTGFERIPSGMRYALTALLAVVAIAALVGTGAVLPGSSRAGAGRDAAYVGDLLLGVASVLLIAGTIRSRVGAERLATAIALGTIAAAAYACYQAAALRWNLPLGDINNTLDSSGLTAGATQGEGALGERVRGTFLEPHFLGSFIATTLPLVCWIAWRGRWLARKVAVVGLVPVLAALTLTVSAPAWVIALVGAMLAMTLSAAARGRRAPVVAVVLVVVMGSAVALSVDRYQVLGALTGRSAADMELTLSFRTESWERALDTWQHRPVLGYGPGQSAVQLAPSTLSEPVLGSAQGIWAAALVDAGIVGLLAWLAVFVVAAGVAGRAVLAELDGLRLATAVALMLAMLTSLYAGDRLEPSAWLLLGLGIVTATLAPGSRCLRHTADGDTL